MPSHSILPDARRAAIAAAFDEALAEVRAAGDVALLQECRAIFRRRVPLNLRAYVAAALVLRISGSGRSAPRKSDRHIEPTRDRGANKASREPPMEERRDAQVRDQQSREKAAGKRPERAPKPERQAVQSDAREERDNPEVREVREIRENRYRGEGVTLFVSAGRRQRFYARIAIKVLLDIPGIADESIGDIRTMDNYSFIVVDPAVEETIISALNGYDFKGRTLAVNRARKKGESEPAPDAASPVESIEPDEASGATEDV